MAKEKSIEEWLKNDPIQIEWLINFYQKKRGILPMDASKSAHQNLIDELNFASGRAGWDDFFKRMQNSWYNYQYNKNKKKNQISVSLEKDILAQLKRLAKQAKCTQTEVIRHLIKEATQFEKYYKEKFEDMKKKLQEKHSNKCFKNAPPGVEYIKLEEKFNSMRKESIKIQSIMNSKFIKNSATLHSLLEDVSILNAQIENKNWDDLTSSEKLTQIEKSHEYYREKYIIDSDFIYEPEAIDDSKVIELIEYKKYESNTD